MHRKPAAPDLSPIRIESGPSITRVRGPRASDGRVYWRARQGEVLLWKGWASREEAVAQGARLVLGQQPTNSPARTVRDVLELWFGAQEERAESGQLEETSLAAMRAKVRPLVRDLGAVQVEAVSVSTLDRYAAARLGQRPETPPKRAAGQLGRLPRRGSMAPVVVARELRTLRAAWAWAHERGLVPSPNLPRVPIKVRNVVERYTPEASEIAAVLEHLHRGRGGWPWLAVRLYWATGCRLSEIATARRCDLDAGRAILRVNGKTGPRELAVNPAVVAELLPYLPLEPGARLLPVAASTVRSDLRLYLLEACAAAGVTGWTAQGLRRFATDALYEAGADPGVEQAQIGHSPKVALAHYRRARRGSLHRAVEAAGLGVLPSAEGEVVLLGVASREATERSLIEAAQRGDLAEVARFAADLNGTTTAQSRRLTTMKVHKT